MEDDNPEEDNYSLSTGGDDNNNGSGDKGDSPGGNPPNAGDSKDNREEDDKNMGGSDSSEHEDYQDSSTHGYNHSDDRDNGNQYPNSQTSDSRTLDKAHLLFLQEVLVNLREMILKMILHVYKDLHVRFKRMNLLRNTAGFI